MHIYIHVNTSPQTLQIHKSPHTSKQFAMFVTVGVSGLACILGRTSPNNTIKSALGGVGYFSNKRGFLVDVTLLRIFKSSNSLWWKEAIRR